MVSFLLGDNASESLQVETECCLVHFLHVVSRVTNKEELDRMWDCMPRLLKREGNLIFAACLPKSGCLTWMVADLASKRLRVMGFEDGCYNFFLPLERARVANDDPMSVCAKDFTWIAPGILDYLTNVYAPLNLGLQTDDAFVPHITFLEEVGAYRITNGNLEPSSWAAGFLESCLSSPPARVDDHFEDCTQRVRATIADAIRTSEDLLRPLS